MKINDDESDIIRTTFIHSRLSDVIGNISKWHPLLS